MRRIIRRIGVVRAVVRSRPYDHPPSQAGVMYYMPNDSLCPTCAHNDRLEFAHGRIALHCPARRLVVSFPLSGPDRYCDSYVSYRAQQQMLQQMLDAFL